MIRFSPTLKKGLLIGTIILLGCDVSMLFAAPVDQSSLAAQQANPQLQQLQSQVQAQIQALQNGNPNAANTNNMPPSAISSIQPNDNVGASLANNIMSQRQPATAAQGMPAPQANALQQPPGAVAAANNLLPPSPYNPVTSPSTNAVPPGMPADSAPLPSSAASLVGAPPADANQQTGAPLPSQQQLPSDSAGAAATPVTDNDLNDAAFNAMVQNSMPMSPDQIQKLRSIYMSSQFAASSVPGTPPRPTATSVFVDLSPGSTPPVVRLSQGFITSLVFVDSTGAAWPIESYDVGNPSAFNIQWDKTSNTLMIQSTVLYTYGNIAVKLKGLDTPVMLTLVPGQKAVDYRVDMRIQGFGPNAQPLIADTLPASTSSDLLNVLDGVPPANSQVLKVDGGDCQAWLAGNKMYVRTRLTVLSPGWLATLSSADGMHAYEMQPAPMLLVSQNGEVTQLKVEGF